MALQSQAWSPATPMPMAVSSLYRQRLEVIAEKRRLQELIRAARRELEEEKLRVERLKRKSLRERWLMDGTAEQPQDPTSKDSLSPEGQAQTRIRNLEDSLFTLQSQLQLLQSASTGAQHKPSGRPTWRRQGHRPLSQPTMEAGPAGQIDLDKRTSLPAGLVGMFPEVPSEPREEASGVPPALGQVPGAAEASSEANGPCPELSPPPEQARGLGETATEKGVVEATRGDLVEVVWEGLRASEDCALGPTGLDLEAKVEEVVLEAIGVRHAAGSPELPAWVKEDRAVVEVVWEGLGGSDSEAMGELSRGPEAAQTGSPRAQERLQGEAPREGEGAPPGGDGQGGSGGEEGSFIWVERVTLSEDWEELLMEGLEGPCGREGEGGAPRAEAGGGEAWELEKRRVEESQEAARDTGSEAKPGTEREGNNAPREPERSSSKEKVEGKEEEKEPLGEESREVEGPLRTERERGEERPGEEKEVEDALKRRGGEETEGERRGEDETERERRGEEETEGERRGEEETEGERRGEETEGERRGEETEGERRGEEEMDGERKGEEIEGERRGEEEMDGERKGEKEKDGERKEEEMDGERKGGKEIQGERRGEETEGERRGDQELEEGRREGEERQGERKGEETLEVKKPPGMQEGQSSEAGRESGGKPEPQAEEVSEAGAPTLGEGAPRGQPQAQPQAPAEDSAPLLAEPPALEQPAESQPLLPRDRPSAHPAPTYAPAPRPEPAQGQEASGPKQKTCQCCALM